MLRSSPDECSDGKEKGDLNGIKATQNLSCDKCDATNFPNLSKLNKHRNTHEKPYECQAEGCKDAFAQKQALDRHTQTKHSDTIAKYYHCTVDGCKYSSTRRRGKRFARSDQVKEHIKDYGHYGPHSANDRPRRRVGWTPLFDEHIITARFEEWTLNEGSPQRMVHSCEYNSLETKLWHTDEVGEMFLRRLPTGEPMAVNDCPVADCYFRTRPPDGCDPTLFKTVKALKEHCRRAHQAEASNFCLSTHLQEENHESVRDSNSMEPSNYSLGNISLNSIVEDFQPSPQDLDSDILGDLDDFMHSLTCHAVQGVACLCQSCSQNEPATSQPLYRDPEPRHNFLGLTSEFQFASLSPYSSTYETHFTTSNISENTTRNLSTASVNSATSLTRKDLLKLSRIPCSLPGCGKTFRRKYDLQRHIDEVHTSSSRRRCPFCEREFRRKHRLAAHLQEHHPISSDLDSTKMKTAFTDVSTFSANDCHWSSSEYPPWKDVAPGDTLMKASHNTGSWTGEATDTFQFQSAVSLEDDSLLGMVWRPASPRSTRQHPGSAASPIDVEEPEPVSSWVDLTD
ncbi:uncharacterized protein PAC_14217 [Phialocephala subalpina]|uniref:C2H2-type domain-containing protein n=1 Tax=Phialocephala subalpina TaxID=576137 RepID=A0A1L7XGZ4_9HELO|nr:uncharacterized protein PAC_14217 [Phialocephala subalpina]